MVMFKIEKKRENSYFWRLLCCKVIESSLLRNIENLKIHKIDNLVVVR